MCLRLHAQEKIKKSNRTGFFLDFYLSLFFSIQRAYVTLT